MRRLIKWALRGSFSTRTDVGSSSSLSIPQRWTAGLAGSLSQGLVRFLYSILIGRVMGAATLGTVNAAISSALLLSLLWPTAAGQAATRFVAQLRGAEKLDQARAVSSYLGRRTLASALPLALAAGAVCLNVLKTDEWTALFAGLLLIGYAGWSFTRGVQYGAGQIARAACWDAAGAVFTIIMLIAVLLLGWEPILLLPLAAGYGLYAVVCWPRTSGEEVDPSVVREMSQFVRLGILGTISSTGLLQLSMIAAHVADSDIKTGYYAAALSVATPVTLLSRTLSQVLFPVMAEAGGRGDTSSLRRQNDATTRALVVTMVPIFGALSLASESVLYIFFGEQYTGARFLLATMLLAVLFTTLSVGTVNRLTSVGISGARFTSSTAAGGLALAIVLWLLLAPQFGIEGIVAGYLSATVCVSLVLIGRGWKLDSQPWAGLWLRAMAGLALQITGLGYLALSGASAWAGIVLAIAFVFICAAMNWRDIQYLRQLRIAAAPTQSTD